MPRASHAHEPASPAARPSPAAPPLIFDRASSRAVDRACDSEYGLTGLVLMESAARGACANALAMLPSPPRGASVIIACGPGNNGGDGYALARLLHNHGAAVTIAAFGLPREPSDAAVNRRICERMRLPIVDVARDAAAPPPSLPDARRFDLVVDAVLGTGLDRPPQGAARLAIDWINAAERPVLAIDVPSGMDCDTGRPLGVCVQATRTLTFVGLKRGFLELPAQKLLGEVHVADIGAPLELIERLGRRAAVPPPRESPDHSAASPSAARASPRRD